MAVDRRLLAQALSQGQANLQTGQDISKFAMDSSNFGSGQARGVGLAAQLATAGIGAFTQYRAQKDLNEQELSSQAQFSKQFPHLADIASTLSPETRQAYTLETIKASLPKAADNQIISGEGGYFSVDKNNPNATATPIMGAGGQVIKPQKPSSTTINVGEQQGFKNETQLRGEYSDRSKSFIGVKEGYEKVVASAKDPSPAGDLALIYGFTKAQDPTSTVRESEFSTTESARAWLSKSEELGITVPSAVSSAINKLAKGTRLLPEQRNDFVDRSRRLYDQAQKSQEKLIGQYTGIANRNKLDPQNIIVDFSTSIEPKAPTAPAAQSGFKVLNVRDK